jgi:glycosyltransferase involved in cell wall biosynthesis
MAKKKIVHIIDVLEQGGAQKLFFDLLSLLKDDFDFYVLSFEGGVFEEKMKRLGIQVEVLGISPYKIGFKYPQNIFRTLKWLREKIKKINPDIVQTHLLGADIWGRLAVPKDISIIQTIHSAEKFRASHSIKGIKTFVFDRILSKKTNLIIAVSNAAALGVIKEGVDNKKIKVIPCGIDVDAFAPSSLWRKNKRQELNIKDNEVVLGAVGRLDWVKGFDILIKAFSKLLIKNSYLKLIIAGEGKVRRNLEKMIKKENLDKNVLLLGERKDVSKLLNAFDIFIMSSRWEGFPLSLIEAAANQKPIIATNVGGIPEFIKDGFNGILVEPENYKNLSEKIDLVLKNPKIRKKIAMNAFESARKFDIKRISKIYKKIYLSL